MKHIILTCDRCRLGGTLSLETSIGGRGRFDGDEHTARECGWKFRRRSRELLCPDCVEDERVAEARHTVGA